MESAYTYKFRLLSFISSHLFVCLFSKHNFLWSFSIDYNNNHFSYEFTVWWLDLKKRKKNAIFFIYNISVWATRFWVIANSLFLRCYFLYWTWTRKHDWLIALSSVLCVRVCLRFIHFHFTPLFFHTQEKYHTPKIHVFFASRKSKTKRK